LIEGLLVPLLWRIVEGILRIHFQKFSRDNEASRKLYTAGNILGGATDGVRMSGAFLHLVIVMSVGILWRVFICMG
jgi:hypothetical protein